MTRALLLVLVAGCTPDPGPPTVTAGWNPHTEPVAPAEAAVTSVDLASRGDELALAWTQRVDDRDQLHIARWSPGGPLEQGIVPSEDVVVGLARRPSVALSADGTVSVSFTTGDPRASTWWLATVADTPDAAELRVIAEAAADAVPTLLDQPEVRIAPDGERWLLAKAEVDHPTVELWLAREGEDFAPTALRPFPGRPCECCPHQLDFTPGGDALLTIRNDEDNIREIWTARAEAGTAAFQRTAQVSTTAWFVPGCPFDGPRMTATRDPFLSVVWVDAATGVALPYLARSEDGGATWASEVRVLADRGTAYAFPQIADDGRTTWVAAEELWDGVQVDRDDGTGWTPVTVPHVRRDGELLVTEGGDAWLLGLDDDGALWLDAL